MTKEHQLKHPSVLTKGMPLDSSAVAVKDFASSKWNILREDLPFPVAILRESALEQNSKAMRSFIESAGVFLCPHGKTTMSPQLFERQLKDGSWGITLATAQQIRVAREFGIQRIFMANQLVGKQNVRYVLKELHEHPDFDFYCLVDSVEGVNRLANEVSASKTSRPLQVLVEVGSPGLRCGCRTLDEALRVARAVKSHEAQLTLRGIEAFEGLFQFLPSEEAEPKVLEFLNFVVSVALAFEQNDLFSAQKVLITAGGSSYFDIVTKVFTAAPLKRPFQVVLRSGCYLTSDSGMYARTTEKIRERLMKTNRSLNFTPAMEVWTAVQSIPEPGLAILTAGKRDCGQDSGLPIPIKWFRPGFHSQPVSLGPECKIAGLSDQHSHMKIPDTLPLKVGDLVGLGISHPCTTFDRWEIFSVVDDEYNVISAVETFF